VARTPANLSKLLKSYAVQIKVMVDKASTNEVRTQIRTLVNGYGELFKAANSAKAAQAAELRGQAQAEQEKLKMARLAEQIEQERLKTATAAVKVKQQESKANAEAAKAAAISAKTQQEMNIKGAKGLVDIQTKLERHQQAINIQALKFARSQERAQGYLEIAKNKAKELAQAIQAVAGAVGATQALKFSVDSVGIASGIEKDKTALAGLLGPEGMGEVEAKIEKIKKSTNNVISGEEITRAAVEYAQLDRNVTRLNKSLDYATVKAAVSGRSFAEVMKAQSDFIRGGNIGSLEGLMDPELLRRMQLAQINFTNTSLEARHRWLRENIKLTQNEIHTYQTTQNKWDKSMDRAKNKWAAIKERLGKEFVPILNVLVNSLTRVYNFLDRTDSFGAVAMIVGAGVAVSGLVAALAVLPSVIGGLQMLAKVGSISKVAAAGLWIYHGAVKAVTLATWGMNVALGAFHALAAILEVPVLVVVALIVGLVALGWLLWEVFNDEENQKKIMEFWNSVKEAVKAAYEWVEKLVSSVLPDWIKNLHIPSLEGVINYSAEGIGGVGSVVGNLWSNPYGPQIPAPVNSPQTVIDQSKSTLINIGGTSITANSGMSAEEVGGLVKKVVVEEMHKNSMGAMP